KSDPNERRDIVFPAPAGINRENTNDSVQVERVPRASGDKPVPSFRLSGWLGCSPRQRG
ncbi:hypothetical protein HCV29_003330, partial [Salmonella enterica]|nr:hypothetical protein [Salmonella enterica]EFP4759137.1 hypothetical protein [Salmonella enterica]